jgi:hypothetical protein
MPPLLCLSTLAKGPSYSRPMKKMCPSIVGNVPLYPAARSCCFTFSHVHPLCSRHGWFTLLRIFAIDGVLSVVSCSRCTWCAASHSGHALTFCKRSAITRRTALMLSVLKYGIFSLSVLREKPSYLDSHSSQICDSIPRRWWRSISRRSRNQNSSDSSLASLSSFANFSSSSNCLYRSSIVLPTSGRTYRSNF